MTLDAFASTRGSLASRVVRWCLLNLGLVALLVSTLEVVLPRTGSAQSSPRSQDFYGIVGRDPWYEYNADPAQWPNQVDQTFMDNMSAGMQELGAAWVRFEFHAQYNNPNGPTGPDLSQTDWYINQDLPAHHLKALGVLGTGIVGDLDTDYKFFHINDPAGPDGTNLYSNTYVQYSMQIINHYGDNMAAYEILNEPNANILLSQETSGSQQAVNPNIYGEIVTQIYTATKQSHPNVQIIAGALLYQPNPPAGQDSDTDWLQKVYASPAVQQYYAAHQHYPWDGISVHPYNIAPDQVLDNLNALHSLMQSNNDSTGIWVTEIGMPGVPPDWTADSLMPPTPSEQAQATFLDQVYTLLGNDAPYVQHVFWFKYEDFGSGDTMANWGLVRLRESNSVYGPDATPWPRKPAFEVYQSLAKPGNNPTAGVPPPANQGPNLMYFPQTGHTLSGAFLTYWKNNGGLANFGYPLTEVFSVHGHAVQYFERARFEYWPGLQGTPYVVQLGLLGRYVTQGRTFATSPPPPANAKPNPNRIYFPETQEYLANGFLDYWEKHGGLAMFGYPISPEIQELGSDGKMHTVQYFERARFEYHPENKPPYQVEVGLLGTQVLAGNAWYR